MNIYLLYRDGWDASDRLHSQVITLHCSKAMVEPWILMDPIIDVYLAMSVLPSSSPARRVSNIK